MDKDIFFACIMKKCAPVRQHSQANSWDKPTKDDRKAFKIKFYSKKI